MPMKFPMSFPLKCFLQCRSTTCCSTVGAALASSPFSARRLVDRRPAENDCILGL